MGVGNPNAIPIDDAFEIMALWDDGEASITWPVMRREALEQGTRMASGLGFLVAEFELGFSAALPFARLLAAGFDGELEGACAIIVIHETTLGEERVVDMRIVDDAMLDNRTGDVFGWRFDREARDAGASLKYSFTR